MITPYDVVLSDGRPLVKALNEHRNWRENIYDGVRTRLDLTTEVLSGVDFSGWDMGQARFTSCALQGTVFAQVELFNPFFKDSDLTDARFACRRIGRGRWNNCNLEAVDFQGINFDNCISYYSDLTDTYFGNCDLTGWQILKLDTDPFSAANLGYLANYANTGVVVNSAKTAFLVTDGMPQPTDITGIPQDLL